MANKDLQDKVRGCLVGGAVGDALGYPVEFMSYSQIVAKYGEEGITRYHLNANGVAEISDDTQMTLFTANGLFINDIQGAYLEWLDTQTYGAKPSNKASKCWISKILQLYSCRAPGNTCLSALHSIATGHEVKNNSKGCGGIMRVAPIAAWGASRNINIMDGVKQSFDAAAMTHKHILGWFPAGMLVYVIQRIIQENVESKGDLINILNETAEIYDSVFNPDTADSLRSFDQGIKMAVELAESDMPDEKAIKTLGEGWTGEEAWYISLYCTLRHFDSFEDAVVASVNHSGDSDSTGAITGNLIGAIHGYSSIPDYYKENLELREVIETMADDLSRGKTSVFLPNRGA